MDLEILLMKFPVMNFFDQCRERESSLTNQVTAGRVWRDFVPVKPHLPPKLRCARNSSCILICMNYL